MGPLLRVWLGMTKSWFICRHDGKATVCEADGLGHRTIATVPPGGGDHRADALLIAAAPDLRSALIAAGKRCRCDGTGEYRTMPNDAEIVVHKCEAQWCADARAALEKARSG